MVNHRKKITTVGDQFVQRIDWLTFYVNSSN